MVFEYLKLNKNVTDTEFDTIYPEEVKRKGYVHWSPVNIAVEAARFLAETPDAQILDIGSGAGKFCLIGATVTGASFTGVEIREHLCKVAGKMAKYHHVPNVNFIHANIMDIDMKAYTGFYFFNAFYENLLKEHAIDDSIDLKLQNYNIYTGYVKEQLEQMPAGTRLATYWSNIKDVPKSYHLESEGGKGLLSMWIKR